MSRRITAVLSDPEGKWIADFPGPTGGWVAILSCDHEIKGPDHTSAPALGDSISCLECKRYEANQKRRNG